MWESFKKKLWAVLRNVRPVRTVIFMFAVLLGGAFANLTGYELNILNLTLSAWAVFFIWQVSVILNDIEDIDIDCLTNPSRPLISGIISIREYHWTAMLFTLFALLLTVGINTKTFLITAFCLLLAYIYSKPPLRLRKNLLGNLLIGVSVTLSFYIGLFSAAPKIGITKEMLSFSFLLLAFGTIITLIKDIKDIEGDKDNHVKNLFTIFGRKRGKIITLIFLFIVLNIPTLFYTNLWTFFLSCLAVYIFYRFESIRGVYLIGLSVIIICFYTIHA